MIFTSCQAETNILSLCTKAIPGTYRFTSVFAVEISGIYKIAKKSARFIDIPEEMGYNRYEYMVKTGG